MLSRSATISFFIVITILFSCVSDPQSKAPEHTEEDTTTNKQVPVIEAWQGNLNGTIPVLMWYSKTDSVLYGQVYYTNQKAPKPIKIIGVVQDNSYRILEFMSDGNITGIWSLTPQVSSAEGDWFGSENKKTLNTSLMHIDTAVNIADISEIDNVTGTYSYAYGKDGGAGHLEVKQIDSKAIIVNFENVTSAPAYNMAFMKDTVSISNNIAQYHSDEFGSCSFKLAFYNNFVIVDYVNDEADCGFGHNATVDGIYLKTQ